MADARLPVTFLVLWAAWIVLTASLNMQELAVGAVASLFVSVFTYKILFNRGIGEKLQWGRFVYGLAYIPAYVREEVKSHLKVIKLIVHPRMPIKPGIVKIPTDLKTDLGLTGLANAITMTPGTLSVEIDEKEPSLYIHWIDVATTEPKEAETQIAGPFEQYLRRIFK